MGDNHYDEYEPDETDHWPYNTAHPARELFTASLFAILVVVGVIWLIYKLWEAL